MLCRTWKVQDLKFVENNSHFTPEQQDDIKQQVVTNMTFTCKKDGGYIITRPDQVVTGTWNLSGSKKDLHTHAENVDADLHIVQLDKKKLVLEGKIVLDNVLQLSCIPDTKGKK
jgi:hypothetical protein